MGPRKSKQKKVEPTEKLPKVSTHRVQPPIVAGHSNNQLLTDTSSSAPTNAQRNVDRNHSQQVASKSRGFKRRDRSSGRDDAMDGDRQPKRMRIESDPQQVPRANEDPHVPETLSLPAEATGLLGTYNLRRISIISSSKIEKKVRRVLEELEMSLAPGEEKPKVLVVQAGAPMASKVISVIEIVKRQMQKEGGRWWQYTKLEGILKDAKAEQRKIRRRGESCRSKGAQNATDSEEMRHPANGEFMQIDVSEEEIEGAFERMASPGVPKEPLKATRITNVPVLTIYLARCRIPALEGLFGEQTNSES